MFALSHNETDGKNCNLPDDSSIGLLEDDIVPIRVVLVDDHPAMRTGLRQALEADGGIVVIAEAGDGQGAVQIGSERRPDIALIDVGLEGMDGIDAAASLKENSPTTRIVLTSGAFDHRSVRRGLDCGVHGFILKTELPAEFAVFIRAIHRGRYCRSERLRHLLTPQADGFELVPPSSRLAALNAREREMMVRLAEGESLKQAARSMDISYKSADHLKQSLMHKLNVHDRVKLVRIAIQEGLVN